MNETRKKENSYHNNLEKYFLNRECSVYMKNKRHYNGMILEYANNFLVLKDDKLKEIALNMDEILQIQYNQVHKS